MHVRGGEVHGLQPRANQAVNTSKPLQTEMRFLASCPLPALADRATLLQITDEAMAVRVSLGNRKRCAFAKAIGYSTAMLSLIEKGERRLSAQKLAAFCSLTGTLLLKQYRDLQEAMSRAEDDQAAWERRISLGLARSAA